MRTKWALILCGAIVAPALAEPHEVEVRFEGAVNGAPFDCARTYEGVGAGGTAIRAQDFRFYVHDVRLVDAAGEEQMLVLDQRTKWQIERTALLDFEDREGGCVNGTAETNFAVRGSVEGAGPWSGVRFTLGVPRNRNHTDLARMPPPLNLTALAWSWNAGRKFARLEVLHAEGGGGFTVHLGSTGCMPDGSAATVPTSCASPNRTEVELAGFDPERDVVIADLGELLSTTDLERNAPDSPEGCRSGPEDADCVGLFGKLGLPFGGEEVGTQAFFRVGRSRLSGAKSE